MLVANIAIVSIVVTFLCRNGFGVQGILELCIPDLLSHPFHLNVATRSYLWAHFAVTERARYTKMCWCTLKCIICTEVKLYYNKVLHYSAR